MEYIEYGIMLHMLLACFMLSNHGPFDSKDTIHSISNNAKSNSEIHELIKEQLNHRFINEFLERWKYTHV